MGRPPLGAHPMTAAERQRRSRAARAQGRAQETSAAVADGELHRLRERVRELEAEVSRLRLDGPALQRRERIRSSPTCLTAA